MKTYQSVQSDKWARDKQNITKNFCVQSKLSKKALTVCVLLHVMVITANCAFLYSTSGHVNFMYVYTDPQAKFHTQQNEFIH